MLRELYNSKNISIAHVEVTGTADKHLHRQMEEIYYIEKGQGQLIIGDQILEVKPGDIIPIPKNTWHYLKKTNDQIFEVLVITHPRYNADDLILENL
ncbi:cupin domain-containing protein [Patescibacteria group bacterium]|nr:cupin domain-containing protein [Patescibacteria group bacterium]